MSPDVLDSVLAFFAIVGAAFCGGVGFAAWRAIDWAEGIRSWAAMCHEAHRCEQLNEPAAICGRQLDGMGLE